MTALPPDSLKLIIAAAGYVRKASGEVLDYDNGRSLRRDISPDGWTYGLASHASLIGIIAWRVESLAQADLDRFRAKTTAAQPRKKDPDPDQ